MLCAFIDQTNYLLAQAIIAIICTHHFLKLKTTETKKKKLK